MADTPIELMMNTIKTTEVPYQETISCNVNVENGWNESVCVIMCKVSNVNRVTLIWC